MLMGGVSGETGEFVTYFDDAVPGVNEMHPIPDILWDLSRRSKSRDVAHSLGSKKNPTSPL